MLLPVLESRGGEVGLPGEGVKVTWARRGLLSPPGSRAELYLLVFSVSTVDPFQDLL